MRETNQKTQSQHLEGDKQFDFDSIRQTCSICMENRSNSIVNACSHHFCFDCIRKWAKNKKTCPICRKKFNQIRSFDKIVKLRHRIPKRRVQIPGLTQRRPVMIPIFLPFNPFSNFIIPPMQYFNSGQQQTTHFNQVMPFLMPQGFPSFMQFLTSMVTQINPN